MQVVGLDLVKLGVTILFQERPSLSLTPSAVNATVPGPPQLVFYLTGSERIILLK